MTRYIVHYKTKAGELMTAGHVYLDRAQAHADEVQRAGNTFLRITDITPLKPADYSPDRRMRS